LALTLIGRMRVQKYTVFSEYANFRGTFFVKQRFFALFFVYTDNNV
jgi:hypothetical protein